MAYSNWGAKVYKNGKRMKNREDVGAFDEDEAKLPSGIRVWFNIIKNMKEGSMDKQWKHSYHAVLGNGQVRLCAYKNNPVLWVWTEEEPKQINLIENDEWKKYWDNEYLEKSGEIIINGQKWNWYFNKKSFNMIDLKLVEPDGTKWTATAGYQFGAGFEDS